MKRRFWGLFLLAFAGVLPAQEFRATVTGHVTDQTGAAVPSVAVQVKNVDTNEVAAGATDSGGNYTVPFLRPGNYTINVEAAGFKKYTREGLTLQVSQTAAIDIKLEVGQVTESVTVTAETPLLETSKADRGQVIDNRGVSEFPLNARNPFMLSMLVAGVNYNGNLIYQRPFDNGAIADWNINGGWNRNNEFLLDGAPNNDLQGGNNIALVPPVDSVQEFKIQTNSYDAQYGKTAGGIINVSLKSGTNSLHGTAYEFARRIQWDANSFQNNARGVNKYGCAPADTACKGLNTSGHFLDQYGFELEGPVYIPKLWNGKDKSFFMVNYEGYREGTPTPLTLSVPAPEFYQGDFSKLVNSAGQQIVIYDPQTIRKDDATGKYIRTPFTGNRIPQDRINPIALNIMKFYPKPNTATAGSGYSSGNLFIPGGQNLDHDSFYNLAIKLDQNIGDKHRLFFRHASNDRTEIRPTNGVPHGPGEDGQLPLKRVNDAYVLDWVATINPTFLANIRVSMNRYIEGSRGDGNIGFDPAQLGFDKSVLNQLPLRGYFGRYEFSGYQSLGRYFGFTYTNTWAVHPNITKIWRGHSIKGGIDMRWIYFNTPNVGNPWRITFDGGWTRADYTRGDSVSGNGIASALLGLPSGGGVDYNVLPAWLHKYWAPYVQDDWKVGRKLTLNLGLRWDLNFGPTERYNRVNRSFDPNIGNPADKLVDRTKFPNLPALNGSILFAGVNGVPRRVSNLDLTAIQPRFGFAYLLARKLVMRGGFGRYYINPTGDFYRNAGFSQSTGIINSLDGGITPNPAMTLANPLPQGVVVPPGASAGALTFLGRGPDFFDPTFKLPYVNQFSFGFQYELPWNSRLEASYVGNRTQKLTSNKGYNDTSLDLRKKCDPLEGGVATYCDGRVPNPFYQLQPFLGTSMYTDPTIGLGYITRPFPEFGGFTQYGRNDGKVWFNSMQVVYEWRGKSGLHLNMAYTLSKMVEQWGFNDSLNNVLQRGLYTNDRPHSIKVGSVWELPFGKGKRFLNTSSRFWSRVFSGWEHTMIFIYNSGMPNDLPSNVIYVKEASLAPNIDWSAPKVYGWRPCVAKMDDFGKITLQPYSASPDFRQRFGCSETDYNFLVTPRNAPRFTSYRDGRLRRHTVPQADMSLNKTTHITERTSAQFRAEVFNVFNTYNFYGQQFNTNPDDSNFGSMLKATIGTGSTSWSRQIQLAVKFLF
jgi:hypothetical protein